MTSGLLSSLLFALVLLYLAGGMGLFVFEKRIHREKRKSTFVKYLVYLIIVLAHLFLIYYAVSFYRILSFMYLVAGCYEIMSVLIRGRAKFNTSSKIFYLTGYAFIASGYAFFQFLPAESLLFLFLVVSAFDGFSQVTGYVFGKRKILPVTSPNKTVEGLVGGAIVAFVPALIMGAYFKEPFCDTVLKCLIIIPAAFAGDYLASRLKRQAGIKDFSRLIPGHGGVIDRFDSHFVSGAVFFLIQQFI